MAKPCSICGKKVGILTGAVVTDDGRFACSKCHQTILVEEEKRKRDVEAERRRQIREIVKTMIVTTTHRVDGFYASKYIGIETVEFVIGTGVFSELSTGIEDFFGARSSAFESKLRNAKNQALEALKFMAAEQGANAVIGVDIDYSEFSGNRVAVIVNGTLVKLKPIRHESSKSDA